MPSQSQTRIPVLDGLRALAVVLVVFRHAIHPFRADVSAPYISAGPFDLGGIFTNGWMGVDLFFVLSGFLIASHLIERINAEGFTAAVVVEYMKRRFFRIAPAYYLVLSIAAAWLFLFSSNPEARDNLPWRYAYHLAFMQDYFRSNIIVVFWSLAVEIKFYLLAPFLVFGVLRAGGRARRMILLAGLVAAFLLSRAVFAPNDKDFFSYFSEVRSVFHFSLDGLLMGCVCAFLWQDLKIRAWIMRPVMANALFFSGAGVIAGALVSGTLLDAGVNDFGRIWLVFILSASFSAMLLGLLGGSAAAPVFSGKGSAFIARVSYSLYLVHWPLVFPVYMAVSRFAPLDTMPEGLGFAVFMPFFLVICMMVSTLLYLCVEKPFIDFSRGSLKQKQRGQAEKGEKTDDIGDRGQEHG